MKQQTSVLLTGVGGFVGKALHASFEENGYDVLGISRRPFDQPGDSVAPSTYHQFDLVRPFEESRVFREKKPFDVVVHAAALSSPWGSRKSFFENNVQATRRLLDYCRSINRPRFIFISSTSVFYRFGDQFGLTEETPPADTPVNLYAESKQEAERLVRDYPGEWCILRPRAVFGRGDTVLFPRILTAARAGRFPLLFRKGDPVLSDLLSIDNLVHYVLQAVRSPEIRDDFNLTDGKPVPVIELLLDVFRRLNIPFPKRKISVATAFRMARGIECLYSLLPILGEPPITRFGVQAFAYSKTFDISKAIARFGAPPVPHEESVKRFVQWVEEKKPY